MQSSKSCSKVYNEGDCLSRGCHWDTTKKWAPRNTCRPKDSKFLSRDTEDKHNVKIPSRGVRTKQRTIQHNEDITPKLTTAASTPVSNSIDTLEPISDTRLKTMIPNENKTIKPNINKKTIKVLEDFFRDNYYRPLDTEKNLPLMQHVQDIMKTKDSRNKLGIAQVRDVIRRSHDLYGLDYEWAPQTQRVAKTYESKLDRELADLADRLCKEYTDFDTIPRNDLIRYLFAFYKLHVLDITKDPRLHQMMHEFEDTLGYKKELIIKLIYKTLGFLYFSAPIHHTDRP